jgi:hypothetical protein
MKTKARPASSLRMESSRIILFGALLMSAFLSSMVHVSPEAAYGTPTSAHSSAPASHPASRR